MGFIGKVMVLLHGALSITVLAWVVGVVTHRIDWNNPPPPEAGGKDKGPGLYDKQKTRAADYTAAVDRAYNRWTTNRNQVDVLEVERYPRRTFYATHLYMIQTGELPGTKVANPVQDIFPLAGNGYLDVRIGPNGQLDVAQAIGRKAVEVRPGVAARAIVQYERDMNKLVEDISASQKKSTEHLVERDKLNREIVGVTQPILVKGLRTLINEQKLMSDQAEAEDRYASVFVTNREAEFGLFKKRRDAMLGRVEELKTAGSK